MTNIYTSPDANLDPTKRAEIRARLSRLVAEQSAGVREGGLGRHSSVLTGSHIFMPIAILLVILLGGGMSVAAEKATPGDALYAVKTGFNENVRGALTVGAESEANWEARLTERRLAEASELEAEGKLDTEVETKLASDIDAHFSKAEMQIESLKAKGDVQGAADAQVRLRSALVADANADASADASATAGSQAKSALMMVAENDSASATALSVRSKSGAIASVVARLSARLDGEMQSAAKTNAAANTNANSNINSDVNSNSDINSNSNSNVEVNVNSGTKANVNANGALDVSAY